MSLLKEFKAFASRGNVIDMAVGIIIGAALANSVIVRGRYHYAANRYYFRRCEF